MTPHAARLIASVIVSGTGAKEIDARAVPRDIAIAEHNEGRSLNATGLLLFLDIFRRWLTDKDANSTLSVVNGTRAGIDRCYNK